jgi:osmotically-inducible protein OsmY
MTIERKREILDDDTLEQLISSRIQDDSTFWTGAGYKRNSINVTVEEGEVTLTGVVRTQLERRRADLLARAVGALTVHNQLQVNEEIREKKRTASAA